MQLDNGRLYPIVVDVFGNPKPVRRLREKIISLARGEVLEIGAGSGANFPCYDSRKVTRLYALEPDPRMVTLARRKAGICGFPIEFLGLPGESIPLGDRSVDTVVTTFTLCTISEIAGAIRGIRRVLKPTGRLLFLEIGLSRDPATRRRQAWWEPLTMKAFAGLRLTRDIPALIVQGGFRLESSEPWHISMLFKAWTHCWWGSAVADELPAIRRSGP